MISNLYFKNYKSFNELNFNLEKTKKNPHHLAVIYGENGSGKSNIIDSIGALRLSIDSLSNHTLYMEALEQQGKKLSEKFDTEKLIKIIDTVPVSSIKRIFSNSKMIDSKENMIIKYNFLINEKTAEYMIEFDGHRLVREYLKYTVTNKIGVLFDVQKNMRSDKLNIKLNENIFGNNVKKDLLIELEKYWGNHSFLSILKFFKENINSEYIRKEISDNLYDVIDEFESINILSSKITSATHGMLEDLVRGKVSIDKREELKKNSEIIYTFFSSLYTDIKDAFYEVVERDDVLEYTLFIKKNIGQNVIVIPFELESNGTKRLLDLLPLLINAVNGSTVIIDEIDTGIHDVLMDSIIENIKDDIKGQLIFSTHDTYLLQQIDANSAYFITIDKYGNKSIKNTGDFEDKRLYQNNNFQIQYLAGNYNAIPYPMSVDFMDLNYDLDREDKD